MKGLVVSFVLIFMALFVQKNSYSQTNNYKITKTISIGGETRWDYLALDTTYNRLYVSHSSSVEVIDLSNDKLIDKIKDLQSVHGICFAPEFNKGFISNGKDSSVTVFDLNTLKVTNKINVTGKNPDAILYDPFSRKVFTMNGISANATAIDANNDKVSGTLKLNGKPEFAVSDLNGKIYVNIEDKSEIQEFDPMKMKVLNTWSIAPGEEPSGLAIDIAHNRLFSVCSNKLMVVVDLKSGKVLKTVPIGEHPDACKFDNKDQLIFSSNGQGNITVVKENSPDEFKVVNTVETKKGARTMAFDPKSERIFTDAVLDGPDSTKIFSVLILDKE